MQRGFPEATLRARNLLMRFFAVEISAGSEGKREEEGEEAGQFKYRSYVVTCMILVAATLPIRTIHRLIWSFIFNQSYPLT